MITLTRCYKYRLYPAADQQTTLVQWAGWRRYVTQRVPELGHAAQAGPLPGNGSGLELCGPCGGLDESVAEFHLSDPPPLSVGFL